MRTTYWQCDWPWKAHRLYPVCDCVIEWHNKSPTLAGRVDWGWRSRHSPQCWVLGSSQIWTGKGKCSSPSSLSPTQKQIVWICVWRRLARELRGYPWGLQGCFPKIASDIHYEQFTKAINRSLQLPPAFYPLSLCQENLWGSDTGSQDLLHAVYVFHSMGLCCFVLLLGFKFFIVWWSILTWVIRQFSFPMYFVSFCCSSFGFLVAALFFQRVFLLGPKS